MPPASPQLQRQQEGPFFISSQALIVPVLPLLLPFLLPFPEMVLGGNGEFATSA